MGVATMTNRDKVFDDLAQMWERRDPMPDGLIDKVLVAMELENLDAEYELLHLVERSRELDGARGVSRRLHDRLLRRTVLAAACE